MARYTKESLLSRIVAKLSLYNPDYLNKALPRLKKFDLIELIGWAIDNDVIDAGSLYQ
jgi:hypothetical protein